jgi:hypothetical protein
MNNKINFIHFYFDYIKIIINFVAKKITIMTEMRKHLPLQCPSCNHPLKVKCLYCNKCHTEVNGSFDLPLLAQLEEKEQTFVVEFVKSSGSLKDMAKNMGISYPTVRNLLDDLIDKLNKMNKL